MATRILVSCALAILAATAAETRAQNPETPKGVDVARAQRAENAVQMGVQGRKLDIYINQLLKSQGLRIDGPQALWVNQQVRRAQDAGAEGPELAAFVQRCVQTVVAQNQAAGKGAKGKNNGRGMKGQPPVQKNK